IPDPLLAVLQRLSDLERKFESWTNVDHFEAIEASVQANLINEVKNQLPKFLPKIVSDFVNPRLESTVRNVLQKTPALLAHSSSTPGQSPSKAANSLSGYELKNILLDKMDKSRSYMTRKTPPKTSKTDKYVTAEEPVEEPVQEVPMDVEEPIMDDVVNDDQPQDDAALRKDNSTWFKQPPRPETPDPE
ncbi:hypothetical protein Tco_1261459, partial [Tanacetum coccineum]